jgi:hypothetical protein
MRSRRARERRETKDAIGELAQYFLEAVIGKDFGDRFLLHVT